MITGTNDTSRHFKMMEDSLKHYLGEEMSQIGSTTREIYYPFRKCFNKNKQQDLWDL